MKRQTAGTVIWTISGILSLVVVIWALPLVFPSLPRDWQLSRVEAEALALEKMELLDSPLPEDAYVVTELETNQALDRRLQLTSGTRDREDIYNTPPGRRVIEWRVSVYPPGERPRRWSHRATLTPSGELTSLTFQLSADEEAGKLSESESQRQAASLLSTLGMDPSEFYAPEMRSLDRTGRTDLVLRYRYRESLFGEDLPYGVEVSFAGDRLGGFRQFFDDPDAQALTAGAASTTVLELVRILAPFALFPFVAFYFLRRYHEGEVGVARGVQVFGALYGAGVILIALTARPTVEEQVIATLSRVQVTWVWGFQMVILWISAVALMAALSWTVGEARCRERWGAKLAAFDALLRGQWQNATVARSAVRGLAAAAVAVAMPLTVLALGETWGLWTSVGYLLSPWWESAPWPGVALLCLGLLLAGYGELFGRLFLLPPAAHRLGVWAGGAAVVALSGVVLWSPLAASTLWGALLLGWLNAAFLVVLLIRTDVLTVLLAAVGGWILPRALPLLQAQDPALKLQGALPLLALALPVFLSIRHLKSGIELTYRFEDVAPHVRRIAERERQRVELETARRIQSSILPSVPPEINGVTLASVYLPATEVGGDFYDVLALEDGRIAVALGDVAGHGVSSGLVMAAAKSALAVQAAADPRIDAVFKTLNGMVFQTARKRLLTTLCYALLDPGRLSLDFACAGHFGPYRLGRGGDLESLESIAYPLGVRDRLEVRVANAFLEPGDTLFFFSDGIVEAVPDGSDEPFGFDRLERVLKGHCGEPPGALLETVTAAVERYIGAAPRQDDQTLLALSLPPD